MEQILYILIAISSVVIIFLGPLVNKMQSVTLWVGKKIAPRGLDKESPNGFQDAITPKSQNTGNILVMISYLVLLVSGSFIMWYGGVVGIIFALTLSSIAGKFYANDVGTYLSKIIHSISNRVADYKKNNDLDRADAANEMLQKLQMLYVEIRDESIEIPSFKEVRAMKVGE